MWISYHFTMKYLFLQSNLFQLSQLLLDQHRVVLMLLKPRKILMVGVLIRPFFVELLFLVIFAERKEGIFFFLIKYSSNISIGLDDQVQIHHHLEHLHFQVSLTCLLRKYLRRITFMSLRCDQTRSEELSSTFDSPTFTLCL